MRRIVIVGASPKPERYAFKAQQQLQAKGFEVIPVTPKYSSIDGIATARDLDAVTGPVDTVTVYLNPSQQGALESALLRIKPERVIFNPGAENPQLSEKLRSAGIECVEACTLVLLATHQF